MAALGYVHHDEFISVVPKEGRVVRVGCGQDKLYLQNCAGDVICLQGSANTLNLLFTTSLTRKSARERGIKQESAFIQRLQCGEEFVGRAELVELCGAWNESTVVGTGTHKIKRPILVDDDVALTIGPVRDVTINNHDISFKEGPEVRLISCGIRGSAGFTDAPTTEQDDLRRCKVLKAIGVPSETYNNYYGYNHINVRQQWRAPKLLEEAFGRCLYVHRINTTDVLVKNYVAERPSVMLERPGTVRGFDRKGNSNIEVQYNGTIDGRAVVATFMLRVDNKAYARPNILQIKVRYL